MQSFLIAVAFLTIIPIRFPQMPSTNLVARSRFWYPPVGLLLGAILAGFTVLIVRLNAAGLTAPGTTASALGAFLIVAVWLLITGALHLDGWCDLCDGLFTGKSAEERLEILRDPHLGTFGMVGGVLLLLGKFAALQDVLALRPEWAPWAVGAAVAWGRCMLLCMAAGAHYPREEGTGQVMIQATRPIEALIFALATAVLALIAMPSGHIWGALCLAVGWLTVMGLRVLCERKLGGITGDCLGAAIEATELILLLTAAIGARLVPRSSPVTPPAEVAMLFSWLWS